MLKVPESAGEPLGFLEKPLPVWLLADLCGMLGVAEPLKDLIKGLEADMRQLTILAIVILLAGMAFSQSTATVVSGYASTWGPQAVYAVPYVPLVTTPSVQLGAPPLAVGASDATAGLATGASTSTLTIETPVVSTVFPKPVWYGVVPQASAEEPAAQPGVRSRHFDFVAPAPETSGSVVQGAAAARGHQRANRTYNNDDVARVNQTNGMIKRGK